MRVPERVFSTWNGDNPMSAARARAFAALAAMCARQGLEHVHVTRANLAAWLHPDHPLHPAWPFLSPMHRGDYLRVYLMHLHGGGHSDVKAPSAPWPRSVFELGDAWVCGYPEAGPWDVAGPPEVRADWERLVGNGAYVVRPGTPLTEAWFARAHALLDERLEALRRGPATFPLDHAELGGPYPLEWNELGGRIFHPLVHRHRERVLQTLPRPVCEGYR